MKNSNKYILTIETTSEVCGVSLICNDNVICENDVISGFNHSITLFNNIDKMLKINNIEMSQVELIKVSTGPGSFTGIRIGVAAALGLSEKFNTRIEYVDTLDSLAYNVINKNDIIISMIDAKCNRVYMSLYFSKKFKKVYKDFIVDVDELCELLNKNFSKKNITFSLVGSGAINYKPNFQRKLKIKYKIYDKNSLLKSSSLAYVDGKDDVISGMNYLLASKAEREKYGKS